MSTNISKAKREELLRQVAEIRNSLMQHQDENTNRLLVYLSNIEKDINGKKYGLVFEEHREAVDELLESHVPVLVEEESLKIDNGGQQNFLIEGDNLVSLKLLEKTHNKSITCIIIDPPYNRGLNDFSYDDNYVMRDDKFKHSKWLSFMKKRLLIAQKLLTRNGVIFINIDDNEFAQLKILCDEIFGEVNFVACFPWHNRTSMQNDTDISINHEYILCYAKNRRQKDRRLKINNSSKWFVLNDFVFQPEPLDESKFSNPDNDPRGKWKTDPFDAPAIRPNLTYEILNPVTGVKYLPPKGRHWRIEKSKYELLLADNRIVFGKTGTGKPQLKVFYKELLDKGQIYDSWLNSEKFGTSTEGKKELLAILNDFPPEKIFDTPKPTKLYKELLKMVISPKQKNPIVLDFFAGSGTTGQSVMQYNQNVDSLHELKYILCTNNQNQICEHAYERLKRIIKSENYKASLKYYKVDFVPITEKVYYEYADKLLLHIKELVELENGLDFDGNKQVEICLTDEDLREYVGSLTDSTSYKAVYIGHDVFVTPEIENKLNSLGIKINIIPDYYYGELKG